MWIRQFLGGVVYSSDFADSEETFGSCGTMTLQGFSFGSVAEVLNDNAGKESDGMEVGFGFGGGYDFCAGSEAGLCEGLFKGIPDKPTTTATIETEFCEIFRCDTKSPLKNGLYMRFIFYDLCVA